MTTGQPIRPPLHPGELLAHFLDDYGITQYRLATDIGVQPGRINEIIHGTRGISANTALRFSRYFGTTAQYWLNAQDRYDLEIESDKIGTALINIEPFYRNELRRSQ